MMKENLNYIAGNKLKKLMLKYYKGLGTTREEDVPDTFGLKMIEYNNDEILFII